MTNRINDEKLAAIRNKLYDYMLKEMEWTQDPFRGIHWANRAWRPNLIEPFYKMSPNKRQKKKKNGA